jgi:hypothetical protein
VAADVRPITDFTECGAARANAEFLIASLRLHIDGVTSRWKIESTLFMEALADSSNNETKEAIEAVQSKER